MRSDGRDRAVKARDNIINAIAANARKLNNDDLLLLLIHSFALIDQAGITDDDQQPEP